MTLTPVVSSQPPNFGVGDTYSFVTIENDQNRPLYAKATYLTNMDEITDLLSIVVNEIRQKPNTNGFDFVDDTNEHYNLYQSLKLVADSKFVSLTADNSNVGNLSGYELPEGFEITGQFYGFQLEYGAVIAYNAFDPYRYTDSLINLTTHKEFLSLKGHSITRIHG
jgi:hypothetical protein